MSALGAADTISQISSVSSRDEKFFITGAKVNKARFEMKKNDEPGSPTARAA